MLMIGDCVLQDYDSFAEALEDNCVEVFFKQAAPKAKPVITESNVSYVCLL